MNSAPPPPPPSNPTNHVWYGLHDSRGAKVICTGISNIEELMAKGGFQLPRPCGCMAQQDTSSTLYIFNYVSPTPSGLAAYHPPHVACQLNVETSGSPFHAHGQPGWVPAPAAASHQGHAPNLSGTGTNLPSTRTTTASAAPGGRHSVMGGGEGSMGKDPSTDDNTQVNDTVVADTEAMDMALCPPGLVDEDRDKLFEQCINVPALPGTYKTCQSDVEQGMTIGIEVFAQVALRSYGGRGYRGNTANLTWQFSSKNVMTKIKAHQDIESLICKISDVKEKVFTGQNQRISRFLHSCCYLQADIDDYLDNGLLRYIIGCTYQVYLELLFTAHKEGYDTSSL